MVSSVLLQSLTRSAKRRRRIMEELFEKIAKTPGKEASYNILEIPSDINNTSTLSEVFKKISVQNLSGREKRILDKVEKILKSNLKELILAREKAKIMYDHESFRRVHTQTKAEIKRLLTFIKANDIEDYIGFCTAVSDDVIFFIEEVIQSQFKEALITQLNYVKNRMYNEAILVELHYLTKLLTEEDVIKYAVHVLKDFY